MKKITTLLLLLFIISFAYSQEDSDTPDSVSDTDSLSSASTGGFFIGLGPEINGYTREGIAIGATITAGMDFTLQTAAGIRVSFFNDLDTVSVLEAQAFYRYYPTLYGYNNFFIEADAGMMIAMEDGDTFPVFAGGLYGGYRIDITDNFVIDAGVRFGYPHMWAVNAIAVYKIAK